MRTVVIAAGLLLGAPAHADEPRLVLDLELYTHARLAQRAGDDLSELRLERGEVGARLALGPQATAEFRLESIRSAVEGGALGIDGDSMVVRVKIAQVTGTHQVGDLRLDGAIGFIRDPWIGTLETGYTVKPLSRTGSERLILWATNDLAASAGAALGPVRVAVSLGNGEGLRYPERNTGKTATGVIDVTAIDRDKVRIGVLGVVRDGSLGVASIRERRFGGGLSVLTPWVRGGAEVIAARGLGDRGDVEGTLVGGWAEAEPIKHWFAAARGATFGLAGGTGRQSTFGGGIAVEPWPQFRLWLAVDRVTSAGDAMPLPGADPGDATLIMVVASAIAPFTVH